MSNNQNSNDDAGIFQLDNGYWGYRYVIKVNGQRKDGRHTVDELGKPFKTKASAKRARKQAIHIVVFSDEDMTTLSEYFKTKKVTSDYRDTLSKDGASA